MKGTGWQIVRPGLLKRVKNSFLLHSWVFLLKGPFHLVKEAPFLFFRISVSLLSKIVIFFLYAGCSNNGS